MPKKEKPQGLFGSDKSFISVIIFSLIYIGAAAFVLHFLVKNPELNITNEVLGVTTVVSVSPEPSPVPVLQANYFPGVSAESVLAVDVNSGSILYEKNPDEQLLPASTTKIVTALVSLDYYPLDKILTVINPSVEGQKMGLVTGERMSVKNLLYGLLVYSANDAAEVLAQDFPGGRDMFVSAMNLKAKELGLYNTHFTNPVGLDGKTHTTTARDLVKASEYAMNNKVFANIVSTKEVTVKSADDKYIHKLTNINKLLGEVDGVLGVKTGWTEEARENLVTFVKRQVNGHERKVMIVVLGSDDRFGETKKLIDWIFSNYNWKVVYRK